jgi:hypothetical protein
MTFANSSGSLAIFAAIRRASSRVSNLAADRRHELIAGRSQLRLATLSLPTHREVVAAAFRISALDAPH